MAVTETELMLNCTKYFLEKNIELEKILGKNVIFSDEIRFLLYAFISAARSTTFYMQTEYNHVEGFKEWYEEKRGLFDHSWVEVRNNAQKEFPPVLHETVVIKSRKGENPGERDQFFIDRTYITLKGLDTSTNFIVMCQDYYQVLEGVAHECFRTFDWPYDVKTD